MTLSYRSEPIRQWRCVTHRPSQAMNQTVQLKASVKAPGKSAEIAAQVPATHCMVGSMQGILDVAE